MTSDLLSILVFLPILGVFALLPFAKGQNDVIKYVSLGFSGVTLMLSAWALYRFDAADSGVQMAVSYPWIETFKVHFSLGLDGFSLFPMLLVAGLFPIVILASWSLQEGLFGYFSLLLALETGLLGTYLARDIFLHFCFWQVTMICIYFLIGIWGGAQRLTAASRFVSFQLLGGLFFLASISLIYFAVSPHSFDLNELRESLRQGSYVIELFKHDLDVRDVAFYLVVAAFVLRSPNFPFHTWYPLAQREAKDPVGALLAGLISKLGLFSFLRFGILIFPEQLSRWQTILSYWAAFNILYGAVGSVAQKDLREKIGYLVMMEVGIVSLGFFSLNKLGISGALVHDLASGVALSGMVLLFGMLAQRRGTFFDEAPMVEQKKKRTRAVDVLPLMAGMAALSVFAVVGVPVFGAFASRYLVLLGTFSWNLNISLITLVGLIIMIASLLWTYRKLFFENCELVAMEEPTQLERLYMIPLLAVSIVLGVLPGILEKLTGAGVDKLVQTFIQH